MHLRVPQEDEVAAGRVLQQCSPVCPLCPRSVPDWTEFYTCLAKHCLIRPGHSGHASEPRSGNRNPSRSGLLQVDKPPEEPSERQSTGVAIASTIDDGHETPPAPESLSSVVHSKKGGKMEEDLTEFSALGTWSDPSSLMIKLSDDKTQSQQPASFVPSVTNKKEELEGVRPVLHPVDSNTSKASQPSDDDESRSMQTNITRPDLEDEFDLDDGIAESEDMEHILNPGAYYRKLDLLEQRTAELYGISSSDLQNVCLSDCKDALENSIKALENLQKEGFCENAFTILVEDRYRFHIASAVRITQDALHDALSEVNVLLTDEVAFSLDVPRWPLICSLLDVRSPKHMFWETLDYLQFLANALTIGLVSFSGSHVCRFDKNLWDEEKNSIPIGNGYAFALQDWLA